MSMGLSMTWEQCVARYLEVAVAGTKMKSVKTPFLVHDSNKSEFRNPIVPTGPGGVPHPGLVEECEWCGFMKGAPRSIAVEEPSEKSGQVAAIAASAAMCS